MDKVTLTKTEAKAIEKAKKTYTDNDFIIHVARVGSLWLGDYEPINEMSPLEVANILIKGYEVEETPEEKLKEYYDRLAEKNANVGSDAWYELSGVKTTLSILGIKIEGINK